MKIIAPSNKLIIELQRGQVEAIKDCFTITKTSRVISSQKITIEDKPSNSSTISILTKKINICSKEKLKYNSEKYNQNEIISENNLKFLLAMKNLSSLHGSIYQGLMLEINI